MGVLRGPKGSARVNMDSSVLGPELDMNDSDEGEDGGCRATIVAVVGSLVRGSDADAEDAPGVI